MTVKSRTSSPYTCSALPEVQVVRKDYWFFCCCWQIIWCFGSVYSSTVLEREEHRASICSHWMKVSLAVSQGIMAEVLVGWREFKPDRKLGRSWELSVLLLWQLLFRPALNLLLNTTQSHQDLLIGPFLCTAAPLVTKHPTIQRKNQGSTNHNRKPLTFSCFQMTSLLLLWISSVEHQVKRWGSRAVVDLDVNEVFVLSARSCVLNAVTLPYSLASPS